MIKQHWAQKVVKKASSIIKSDVLILNRSGYVIATSNSDKIGVFYPAARHSIQRNLSIDIEKEDMKFWKVKQTGVIIPITHSGKTYGALFVVGEPDEIRIYSHLLKLNAEFIVEQEFERSTRFEETLSRTQMLAHILFNPQRQIQAYNRKNVIEKLGLNEDFTVALISINSTSKTKIMTLRRALEDWKLPSDDIIEISPSEYVFILKSNDNRGQTQSEIRASIESEMKDEIFSRTLITLGSITNGLQGLIQSYNEATSLKVLMHDLKIQEGLHTYKSHELETICNNIKKFTPSNEMSLVSNYKKLLDFGEDKYLNETIEAYFRNHGKLVKTANDLFIHRNTLNYRIKKIHEITGWDPNTIDGIVLLRIAQILYERAQC
ncbi:sugar diacid recognition domain-containing protein [Staphylococcus coagulans]|uniref:sugar diacid recognition domain-containing protein n=1 Tax=Staphylococcus coagulans TaxID=74706 RepID=UPI001C0AE6E7|nr:sugar diacid recognition domain-containing protein [Staphylococcus coagulans]MBU3872507.1 helix-turn-helix domain-containing protein [Staphylococcus coagulans]